MLELKTVCPLLVLLAEGKDKDVHYPLVVLNL